MSPARDILSLAADFIARVTAYLFGLRESYAPEIMLWPEHDENPAGLRLVPGLAWEGRRARVVRIYTTPSYAPHLLLSGKPAVRLADAKRCPHRCIAQRWLEKFRVYLTYDCTARGDVVLPKAWALGRIIVGRDPPEGEMDLSLTYLIPKSVFGLAIPLVSSNLRKTKDASLHINSRGCPHPLRCAQVLPPQAGEG